jgi:hypothetical protein
MKNLSMYCLTMRNADFNIIKSLEYFPVGLGDKIVSKDFLRDNSLDNISSKNYFYGEYTFHYWLWKNALEKINDGWIGFCQYRKFWIKKDVSLKIVDFDTFNKNILKTISNELDNYESIIGVPLYTNQFKLTKFIKKNLLTILSNPSFLFNKNKRNLKFHFDMMHGKGNLEKAINLLDEKEKDDFMKFMNTEVSFNPHNMFICKNKKILKSYYESVFPWLERCEKEFGFDLQGYGLKRIYAFLAERYMSYWFKKYTNFATIPILFKDISDFY